MHLTPAFAHLGYSRGDFPHAETVAGEILSLPLYPQLGEDGQSTVVEALAAALGRS